MASFTWKQYPDTGACLTCGSATNTRGFVDLISEVNVVRDGFEITGVVDVYLCASCLEQAAALIGSPMLAQATDWAYKEAEYQKQAEQLKNEVQAWQQRLLSLANLDIKDFEALAKLEAADATAPVTEPAP